jgi:DNA-binding CsgD family transcriptional regulator
MEPMLCPVLIERAAEMQALVSALDAAGQGRGIAVFLTGDAGVGKSRLVREATTVAADRGFFVLTGRATDSSVPVPFRPISEALMGAARGGVVPDVPGIADYRPALGTLVPEWSRASDGDAEVSPVIFGEALLRMLSQPGRPGGFLVLEDLHWADPESVAIVEYLADNIGSASVACLITIRDTAPSPALDLLRSITARRAATRIEVQRLGTRGVAEMAAACLGVTEMPQSVGRLLRNCDGLPFAVEEILAAAVASGELVHADAGWRVDEGIVTGVPPSIVGSVRRRIAALDGLARNVIVSAAVLGRQFDWALLPDVADVTEKQAMDALHEAHAVQLIEPAGNDAAAFRFRHSLTRQAIVSDLLPPELATRSARAAAAVETAHPDLPGAWCELAAELRCAAGQPLDAAQLLLAAGRRALRQGAATSAIAALQDARRLLADAAAEDRARLDVDVDEALVDALALSGKYEQLDPLMTDLLARLGPADERRQALIRIRAASTRPEDNAEAAAEHLAVASVIADRLQEPELASRVDVATARYALVTGEFDRAEELASRSLAAAESAGLTGWAAEVAVESLGMIGRIDRIRNLAGSREAFERAYQIADSRGLAVWRIAVLHRIATIAMLDDLNTSDLVKVRDVAHSAGLFSIATTIDLQLANLLSLSTDTEQAMVMAEELEREARLIGSQRLQALGHCLQGLAFGIRGDALEVEQCARRAEAVQPGDPEVLLTTVGQVRVVGALFRDDVAQAMQYAARAGDYAAQMLSAPRRARGYYSPTQIPVVARGRSWALRALLAAVGGGGASEIEQAELMKAAVSWNRGCLGYAQAVLAGRAGEPERAAEFAAAAAAAFGPFAPWWNHLARRLVAQCALRDGWGEPVAWLREAAASFAASGHVRLASACRGLLRQAGVPVPRSGRGSAKVPAQLRRLGVTSREMDVYLLVARGYSNSQIAERLYISPKTVETHVASLVAKTGQAGRRELVAYAAQDVGDSVNSGLPSVLAQGRPDVLASQLRHRSWKLPQGNWKSARRQPPCTPRQQRPPARATPSGSRRSPTPPSCMPSHSGSPGVTATPKISCRTR